MKQTNHKSQTKVASARGGSVVAENREISREIKEIKRWQEKNNIEIREVKKILNNGKKSSISSEHIEEEKKVKITGLKIKADKLFVKLNDNRELSIPIDWFAKWGVENVKAEKLKNYEIWEGEEIYFPEIDEVLGIEKFTKGFDALCE